MIKTCILTDKGSASIVAVAQEDGGTIENCYATTADVATANNNENSKNVQLDTEYYKAASNPGNVLTQSGDDVETELAKKKDELAASAVTLDSTFTTNYPNAVARILDHGYDSLADAVSNASAGDIIVVLKNITNSIGAITIDKSITIDGCDLTISGGNESGSSSSHLSYSGLIIKGNSVVVKNITLTKMGNYAAIEVKGTNATIDNVKIDTIARMAIDVNGSSASATINECHIDIGYMKSNTGNAVQAQYGGHITLTNTTIENVLEQVSNWTSAGLVVWDNSVITVDSCTFKQCDNAFALSCCYGEASLTISNTELVDCNIGVESTTVNGDTTFALTLNSGNNFNVTDCLELIQASSSVNYSINASVTINGGSYSANNGQNELFTISDNGTSNRELISGSIIVNGGTFSSPLAKYWINGVEQNNSFGIAVTDNR